MFEDELNIFCKKMEERLIEKQAKHGDTWKTISISDLRGRVDFLYGLWRNERALTDEECKALIDIANQSMLLYIRIKKKNRR